MSFLANLKAFVLQTISGWRRGAGGSVSARANTVGLVRIEKSGVAHQMQLWIRGSEAGYYFEVRQLFAPNGRIHRSCVLDTGKLQAKRQDALREGNKSMDLLLK